MDFGLLYENDAGEYVVLNDVRIADIRLASLVYLFVYVSTNCVPIAHLRQNKPFPLLYSGHAQIIRKGPCYTRRVCNRLLYRRSVHIFGKSKYSCQNFFSVQPSFDGKQYVCKTCHLIQTFSINTSVPLLTEFDSITNIQ